jgi:hypothetical protein
VFLAAASPVEIKSTNAYQMISTEYERTDTTALRHYADTYYSRYAQEIVGKYSPPRTTLWRDYRATVLAFAKSDADPTSADRRRGADSILVSFRDWITPWINLGYLADETISPLVQQYQSTLGSKIVAGRSYADAARTLQQTVTEAVADTGLIGSMRKYRAMDQALNQVTVSNPPSYMPDLTGALQQAVRMQHTLERSQAGAVGVPDEKIAFQALTDATTRADVNVSNVTTQLGALQAQVQQANQTVTSVNSTISGLQTSVSAVNGRLDGITSEGGALTGIRADLNTVKGQIVGFQQLNPSDVTVRLSQVTGLSNRLAAIEQKVG